MTHGICFWLHPIDFLNCIGFRSNPLCVFDWIRVWNDKIIMRNSIGLWLNILNMFDWIRWRHDHLNNFLSDWFWNHNFLSEYGDWIRLDHINSLNWNILYSLHLVGFLSDHLNPFNCVRFGLDPFSMTHWVRFRLDILCISHWNWIGLDPFKTLNLVRIRLDPFSSCYWVWFVLDPFSLCYGIRLWLNPFNVFLSDGVLRNVFYKSFFDWRLWNEFSIM